MVASVTNEADATTQTFQDRRRIADRVFRGALIFNAALTVLWLVALVTGRRPPFSPSYRPTPRVRASVLAGILFFYVMWGFIWYGVKTCCSSQVVGFSKDERRQAFSSRMSAVVRRRQAWSPGIRSGGSGSST